MHMMAPVSAGTLTGVCVRNSIHTIPARAACAALSPSASRSRANETRRMLFAVATPMHMIMPVRDGTLNVVCVSVSVQMIPANAPGSAVMMMNGSSHDWKFTTISK